MKRFGVWLTMVAMLSVSVLAFAQATTGSTDSKTNDGGSKKDAGKKATRSKTRKGTTKDPANKGNAKVTDTGRKGLETKTGTKQ